jgi:hypothetical protein
MRGASLVLVVLAAIAAGIVLLKFGTLSPCGIVRYEIRQEALRQGGFGAAIAAVLPDAALDAIVATKYGSLTPGRCISILLGNPQSGDAETVAARSQLTPAQQAAKLMATPPAPTTATPAYTHRAARNPNGAAMAVRVAPPAESYSPWAYLGPAWMQAIYKVPKHRFAKPLLVQVLFLASQTDCATTSRAAADALTQENTPPGCHANACTPLYLATCTRITVGNGGIGQIGP